MKKKSLLIALAAFVVVCAAAVAIYFVAKPDTHEGSKKITVEIVYADSSKESISISTDSEYLSEALVEADIIKPEEASFFTTVKGVTADFNKDGSWWCITKDHEMCMVGASELVIANGDHFELTYTIGFSE